MKHAYLGKWHIVAMEKWGQGTHVSSVMFLDKLVVILPIAYNVPLYVEDQPNNAFSF